MNELHADFQKAVVVLMQFMFRLIPLALSKRLPEEEWKSFSDAFEMSQARMTELQAYVKASQTGQPYDPQAALGSVLAFKASLDDLQSSLDKLLIITGASEQDRQLSRNVLVGKFDQLLSQENDQFVKALAALSNQKDQS